MSNSAWRPCPLPRWRRRAHCWGTPAPQTILHLEIAPDSTSIEAALRHHSRPGQLKDFADAEFSKTIFTKMPRVLTIALCRFARPEGFPVKISAPIQAPEELKIPVECLHPDIAEHPWVYRLRAFAHHEGWADSGHYTAFGRDEKDEWHRNDDMGGRSRPNESELKEARDTAYIYTYELSKL